MVPKYFFLFGLSISSNIVFVMFQGPLGWQSMSGLPPGETLRHREIDFFINADEQAEINAISWEATIQKQIEEELYDPTLDV